MVVEAYLSHPIRGFQNNSNTDVGALNVQKAVFVGNAIRLNIPSIKLYIPGEHQAFVSRAYHSGVLTDEQILKIDCDIMCNKELVIFYDPDNHFSAGMTVEQGVAHENGIEQVSFQHINWAFLSHLVTLINE